MYFNVYYVKDTRDSSIQSLRSDILKKYEVLEYKDLEFLDFNTNMFAFQLRREQTRKSLYDMDTFVKGSGVEKTEMFKRLAKAVKLTFLEGGGSASLKVQRFCEQTHEYFDLSLFLLQATYKVFSQNNEMVLSDYRLYLYSLLKDKIRQHGFSALLDSSECMHFADVMVLVANLSDLILLKNESEESGDNCLVTIEDSMKNFLPCFDLDYKNMPMVCPPKDWFLDVNGKTVGGGFLLNKGGTASRSQRKDFEGIRFSQEGVDNLNYIQSTPFQIDKIFLREMRHDFNYFLDKEGFRIHRTWGADDFVSKKKKPYETYFKEFSEIKLIIELIEQATYLSNFESFWFPVYTCSKGSIFYEGWPLNPEGGEISRRLLKFEGIHRYSSKHKLDISLPNLRMLALITCDLKSLNLTNLVVPRQSLEKTPEIQDPYKKYYAVYRNLMSNRISWWLNRRDIFSIIIDNHLCGESFYSLICKLETLKVSEYPTRIYNEVRRLRQFLRLYFKNLKDVSLVLDEVIRKSSKKGNPIRFSYNRIIKCSQFYALRSYKVLAYNGSDGRPSSVPLEEDILPLTLNIYKTKKKILKNLWRYLNAVIIQKIISRCRNKKIPLVLFNNRLLVHKKHKKNLSKIFYDSISEIFFKKGKDSFLEFFLKDNLGNDNFLKTDDSLLKYRGCKKNLKISKYKKSPFLLE